MNWMKARMWHERVFLNYLSMKKIDCSKWFGDYGCIERLACSLFIWFWTKVKITLLNPSAEVSYIISHFLQNSMASYKCEFMLSSWNFHEKIAQLRNLEVSVSLRLGKLTLLLNCLRVPVYLIMKSEDMFDPNLPPGQGVNKSNNFCLKLQRHFPKITVKSLFMLTFSILAIIQGMSYTYFSATLTTLEKRLKISSKTASELT